MSAFTLKSMQEELDQLEEDGISVIGKQYYWNTAEDVKDVVEALNSKEVVHYLTLDGNTLGVEAAKAIGQALEKHPEFCKALWKNMFTGRLKTEIPDALSYLGHGLIMANAHLHTLDLSDNALGPNGMKGLVELLQSPVCYSLKELYLNNCGLGIGGGEMLSDALIHCYENSLSDGVEMKLEVLVIGRNRLEDSGAEAITKLLSTLCTLRELVMPQNSIYHEGIASLSEGIKLNPQLRVLNLNDNVITSKGAVHLAEAFAFTPRLREINFGDCLLKTTGAICFADALQDNHVRLEVIDLGFNEIELEGGLSLVRAVNNKPNLKLLNLNGNNFGEMGCESIQTAMKSCANPDALGPMDEDEEPGDDDDASDDDDDDDDDEKESEDGDDDDYKDGEDLDDLELVEELYEDEVEGLDGAINKKIPNYCNDTTQVVDEDDYDQSAYVTSVGFPTKLFGANESCISNKSVSFADTTTTMCSNVTMESFCLSQTPCTFEMFESLPQKDLQSFLDFLESYKNTDNYLLLLVFTTLKCAHLSGNSSQIMDLAVDLYKTLVNYAVETQQVRRITNYLLKQLHLLRSEVKFRSKYDLNNCHFALREALRRNAVNDEYMRNTFDVFLSQSLSEN